jgi:phospholipase/carboxylesterase
VRRLLLAVVCACAFVPWPAAGQDAAAAPPPRSYGPGRYDLKLDTARDGTMYVPSGYKAGTPMPLLVWLHGAGGSGQVSTNLAALADEFGFIVVAPDSRQWTWDAILGEYGPDVEFLQRAVGQAVSRCSIDRSRLWLGGFSDGASYSLSLGVTYGDVFRRVYAGSPGVLVPLDARGKPAIFISHGRQDQTMPIDETSRKFVPRLQRLGYDVTYREYDGRHQLPPEILREAIEWMTQDR